MIKKFLLGASFLLLCAGCAGQTKVQDEKAAAVTTTPSADTKPSTVEQQETKPKEVEIPEPYSLALKKIESGELDTALKYLDFTINDFKDSPYVYNAQLLKSVLHTGKAQVALNLGLIIGRGTEKGKTLYSSSDINRIKKKFDETKKEMTDQVDLLAEPAKYTLENYSAVRDQIQMKKITVKDIPSEVNLDFFASVGYPIPTDAEFDAYIKNNYIREVSLTLNTIFQEDKIIFPDYFYFTGSQFYKKDKALTKQFFDKIIEITENDKYNEVRILVQEDLKKNFK
ncbi:hypothetical protein [Paenibacillus chitinolyticus]|uniref:hypothetical protein n=1 Tax=Paenibacillus chitinolyticus TaxID=79263 RepID=UPI001C45AE75|nr:hypothetical protein [Paenibacillus chitinolyticus]MBV6717309.1 hypothetical protein [Paenibacillus chitinolyticus]